MIYKKDIINFIFVLSFPMYGVGCYLGRVMSPSRGIIFNILPFMAIIVFYMIDVLYKREFQVKVRGGVYWWMMAYLATVIAAVWVAFYKGTPLTTLSIALGTTMIYISVFHAFIIVYFYNGDKAVEAVPRLTLISIGLLLFINVVGFFGLGFSRVGFEGGGDRIVFPFFQGHVEAGTMAAIMSIIIIWLIRRMWADKIVVAWLVVFMLLGFFILLLSNSRISILITMLTIVLFVTQSSKSYLVYWISLFTLPLVLNSRQLLYKFMSLPILKPIMLRTDFEDIVTLNGRTILWERAFDWLQYDQRGLFFGLGLQGQYFISLLNDIQLIWNPVDPHIMHWHSATLEVLVDQGLIGLIPLLVILYKIFVLYRKEFISNTTKGMFFMATVFLLFNVQIDTFIIFGSTGTLLFFLLVAGVAVKTNKSKKSGIDNLPQLEVIPA